MQPQYMSFPSPLHARSPSGNRDKATGNPLTCPQTPEPSQGVSRHPRPGSRSSRSVREQPSTSPSALISSPQTHDVSLVGRDLPVRPWFASVEWMKLIAFRDPGMPAGQADFLPVFLNSPRDPGPRARGHGPPEPSAVRVCGVDETGCLSGPRNTRTRSGFPPFPGTLQPSGPACRDARQTSSRSSSIPRSAPTPAGLHAGRIARRAERIAGQTRRIQGRASAGPSLHPGSPGVGQRLHSILSQRASARLLGPWSRISRSVVKPPSACLEATTIQANDLTSLDRPPCERD
jgi:hypothetical protein